MNEVDKEQETGNRYDASARLAEFRKLRARGALCTTVTEQLSTEAANAFIERFESAGEYLDDAITLLAEISTLEEPCLSEPGRRATFPLLIEHLSDSFDPRLCLLYDRAFAQMIAVCRKLPSGAKLDSALRRFGMVSEPDLIERKARLRNRPPLLEVRERQKVRKVLIFSRVTLGAEVAITSIVIQKTKRSFPGAEIVILGSPKLVQLFGGDGAIRIREIRYRNEGGLLDRLHSWLPVIDAVEQETRHLRPEEYVLLDPDSRLLQLGLLPALQDDSRYFFLESRAFGETGQGSMSRITLQWLESIFGSDGEKDGEILPALSLRDEDRAFGQTLCRKLRPGGSGFLVAASFGVGGNPDKRLPDPFEEDLLLRLLEDGSTVLLDRGFGDEEAMRAERLAAGVRSSGRTVIEADATNAEALMRAPELRCDLFTWNGEIGRFAALIAGSDEYIGYDSAGQHIAAALGIPTIDIFAHPVSPVFQERWSPSGRGIVHVVTQKPPAGNARTSDEMLSEVLLRHQTIKSSSYPQGSLTK